MSITLVNIKGQTVVDSRIIAEGLGIEHGNLRETIYKYQSQIEQAFGVLRFETDKPRKGTTGGRPDKYFLLSEDQATFILKAETVCS